MLFVKQLNLSRANLPLGCRNRLVYSVNLCKANLPLGCGNHLVYSVNLSKANLPLGCRNHLVYSGSIYFETDMTGFQKVIGLFRVQFNQVSLY